MQDLLLVINRHIPLTALLGPVMVMHAKALLHGWAESSQGLLSFVKRQQ